MKLRIFGIGEVLWDLLPAGRQLGGAPANFAYHARSLGANAQVISRIGADEPGRDIIQRFRELALPLDLVQVDPAAPTGTVSVAIDASGQPSYLIHRNAAWDNLAADPAALREMASAGAVCFGTLAQRAEPSRSSILSLAAAAPAEALRIFDINLRQDYFDRERIERSLEIANVLKLNDAELPVVSDLLRLRGTVEEQIAELARRFELRTVACTRGDRGSLLFSGGEWDDHPGVEVTVADTVGAGDSFTAAMAIGLLKGWALARVNETANRVAASVAAQAGATPPIPAAVLSLFTET